MYKSFSSLLLTAVLAGCKATFDMAVYEDCVDLQEGANARPADVLNQAITSSELVSARIPPGVYADHGILLYREGKLAEAVERITKEEEHYPESKQFMQRLLALILKVEPEPEAPARHRSGILRFSFFPRSTNPVRPKQDRPSI